MQLNIHYFDDAWNPSLDGLNWRAVGTCENGADSVVVARNWVRWRSHWGGSSFRIVAWDHVKPVAEADPRRDYWELPDAARSFTAEGRRDHDGVVVAVDFLQLAK